MDAMALTLERIENLAPDQSSLAAARKLLKPAAWPALAMELSPNSSMRWLSFRGWVPALMAAALTGQDLQQWAAA
jgi:hypothetical protein